MEIKTMLEKTDSLIIYEAFGDEPILDELIGKHDQKCILISKDRKTDPIETAEKMKDKLLDKEVIVMVPGRAFDIGGTRHGRGGGWYDRFLNKVPKKWIRIGVLTDEYLSKDPLTKNPWDEPMDFLLIQKNDGWEFYKTTTERDGKIRS